MTAIYFPGNALSQSVGFESQVFGPSDLSSNPAVCHWGAYDGFPVYSFVRLFGHTIPAGPLLLAFRFDGSTTEMLELEGTSTIYYSADLAFAPLPGSTLPTATEVLQIPEPPSWIMNATYEAALLGDSVDLTTDLDAACDRNDDGVIDAADQFVYTALMD